MFRVLMSITKFSGRGDRVLVVNPDTEHGGSRVKLPLVHLNGGR